MNIYNVSKINGLGNVKKVASVQAEFFEIVGTEQKSIKFYVTEKNWYGKSVSKIAVAYVSFKYDDAFTVEQEGVNDDTASAND
jgi:hypothetical protein